MMKMHGLGDGPYWMISYAYFLLISLIYMLSFVIFGSVIGNLPNTPVNSISVSHFDLRSRSLMKFTLVQG